MKNFVYLQLCASLMQTSPKNNKLTYENYHYALVISFYNCSGKCSEQMVFDI